MGSADDELEGIRQLKARYFRFMDTKDWSAWRELFADDVIGKLDHAVSTRGADPKTGPPWIGVDVFVPAVIALIDNCTTVHHGYTPELELTSDTTATGVWAMADIVEFPDGRTLYGAGHYHETYTKTDGVWRIQSIHLTRTRLKVTRPSG
jgi:SnoaL-like domain